MVGKGILFIGFMGVVSLLYLFRSRKRRPKGIDYYLISGSDRTLSDYWTEEGAYEINNVYREPEINGEETAREFQIPKTKIPLILGPGRSTLKNIQESTNCSLHIIIGNEPDPYCLGLLIGREDNVQKALSIIDEIIHLENHSNQVLEMYVPEEDYGRIIGKSGKNIQFIRHSSNAKITLQRMTETKQAKVTIIGNADEIDHAKKLLFEKIEEEKSFRKRIETNLASRSPRRKQKHPKKNQLTVPGITQTRKEELTVTSSDGLLEIYVSAMDSPERFWVHMVGPRSSELDKLNDLMTDYYSEEDNRKRHELRNLSLGQIVAAPYHYDNKWYRTEVLKIEICEHSPEESEIHLFYVDYGDSAYCKKKDVYELRTDFLELRFQTIECTLARVKPRGTWSEDAIDFFADLVHTGQWKSLTARIRGYKEGHSEVEHERRSVPCVDLYSFRGREAINIGLELVKNEFAEWEA